MQRHCHLADFYLSIPSVQIAVKVFTDKYDKLQIPL